MDLSRIEQAAADQGLTLRGAFHPRAADRVPALADGRPAGTLVLLGNVGAGLWERFSTAPEFADGGADPLNRWSERVIDALAEAFRGRALFPFGGPPYQPFVAWAKRAEPVAESPLGMLIHPEYGLWHAYRGALALVGRLELPSRDARPRPCESCADKPCLSACPVGAFTGEGYDVAACAGHIAAAAGADCLEQGCRARRACPVGRELVYGPAQGRFHMSAFLKSRRGAAA